MILEQLEGTETSSVSRNFSHKVEKLVVLVATFSDDFDDDAAAVTFSLIVQAD